MRNFWRPVRSRPIRLFLIMMLAVPLVSLVALWAFAASITVRGAISDHTYNTSVTTLTTSMEPLTIELPAERDASYLWLISDRRSSEAALLATRRLVDEAIPVARSTLQSGSLFADSRSTINALFAQLAQLGRIRAAIDSGTMSPTAAFQAYSDMMDAEFRFFKSSIQYRPPSLAEISIGTVDSAYAYELARREATLVAGALADRGQMTASARQLFASSVANRNLLMNDVLVFLTPDLRAPYLSVVNSPEYQEYQAMEDRILASPGGSGPIPVTAGSWQASSGTYLAALLGAELKTSTALATMTASLTNRQITEAVLAGGAGLLAVVASVILLVWFGRKVTRDLTRLDNNVRGMAQERLPRVVEQLRRGDDVDVLAESPPPDTSTIREIAQIAESFAAVQTAAVGAAVDQARMRKGVNQVFLNISMRSQSLLHRQLAMLDSMERRTGEGKALADLFRLDHLTTRMRRHAEGLIILSGATPGRGWRDPVPVVDVLRAAVAEVEDYVRVDVVSESQDLVTGNAVNDVIHLVAELIENATVFSPPNTRVEVRAERVGVGLAAEIEDRGLGMGAGDIDDINRRLASAPEFDLADSEQLGLFVVGRLAARHHIKVSLRPSAYGGITAVVLLPFGVIVREEDASPADDPRSWPPVGAGTQDVPPPATLGHPMRGDASPGGAERQRPEGRRISTRAAGELELEQTVPEARAALPPPPAEPWAASPAGDASPMTPWPGALKPAATQMAEPAEGPSADSAADQPRAPLSRPPTGAGRPGPVSSGSHLGMPVRVPQASLAPQLRGRPEFGWWATAPEEPEVDERPPEVTGNMMASMQRGWQRGRVDGLDEPQDAPSDGTD
jgi:signal transduction histidine kinase